MIKPLHTGIMVSDTDGSSAVVSLTDDPCVLPDLHEREEALDTALFLEIAKGNEAAFREFFERYSPLFSYIIHKITRDESLIPDYLQDTFLKIWLKRDLLATVKNPRRWAMQIVYHLCFNHLKHKQVQQRHLISILDGRKAVTKHNAVEREIFHKETDQALKNIILQLPPQTQKVYRLSREEGLDIQQIAEKMELSSQTVRNTLCRGVKMIRLLLKKKGILVVLLTLLVCLWVPYLY